MTYVQPGNAAGPYATPHPWQPTDDPNGPQVLLRVADLNRELATGPRPQQPVQMVQPAAPAVPQRPAERQAERPVERPITPLATVIPTADPMTPQTTISAAVLPSISPNPADTTVTAEVQSAAPTLAVLATKLAQTVETPTAPVATAAATTTTAPAATVTTSAQHRPLPFLSSFLLSSRRRQLMTFSLAVMALLVLFRAPTNRSANQPSNTESTTQRDNPPRRVAEGSEDAGQSAWETGIPATPPADSRGSNTTTSPAGWTQSANESPAPSTAVGGNPATTDSAAATTHETESVPEVDLTGMEYPATDPATFQYPANAHDLIISMLARDHAGH
ncbi:MAG: hypothetical protein U0795_07550 [Pirellulales bacterium]